MKLKKLITGVLGVLVLSLVISTTSYHPALRQAGYQLLMINLAFADDFEPADIDENASNNFILDADDTGGDVSLQFGSALAETLTWDDANTRFNLSDDFVIDGNLGQNGTSFTLDFDEAGNPDQDIDIIAGQGSENNGIIRYDDGSNRWEFSNDGTTFQAIPTSTGADLATAQMRETDGDIINNGAFADIDFNVVDTESSASIINADETTDSFTVLVDGFYLVSYSFSSQNDVIQSIDGQVLLNGSTVINGSTLTSGTHTAVPGGDSFGQTFIAQLSTNDSITLQMSASGAGNNIVAGGVFTITKLDGVTGDAGPSTGNNTFTIDDDDTGGDVSLQFGATLAESLTWNNAASRFDLSDDLQVDGTLVVSTSGAQEPIATFESTDNDVSILLNSEFPGSGEAYMEIQNNSTGANSWKLGLNDSDTLGLFYGTANALNGQELVQFDTVGATSFSGTSLTLDSDNVGGGVDLDIVAEQGSDNNGTIRYSATNNRWEASNDAGNFDAIQTANVFYAYDAAGGQTINATEFTLNLDTTVVSDSAYTLAADEVTINEDGLYRIKYQVGMDDINTTGGARSTVELTLQVSGVDIPGAAIRCYHREARETSCSLEIVHALSAADVLRARIDRINGSTNYETEPNHSRLIIEKIR